MKRKAIFLATLMACGMAAEAQQKQSGAYANGSHNTVLARKAIDTANLRIKYAWGATDITQDSTYLDCGQLLVGQRMTKYSSWFIEVADSQRVEWAKNNPHAQNVPNGTWWMRGKKPGIWSEYQYSSIYIHGDTLNEWAIMPMGQEWPQRYDEIKIHPALNAAAVQFVKKMPKWKPAKLKGKAVRQSASHAVQFRYK